MTDTKLSLLIAQFLEPMPHDADAGGYYANGVQFSPLKFWCREHGALKRGHWRCNRDMINDPEMVLLLLDAGKALFGPIEWYATPDTEHVEWHVPATDADGNTHDCHSEKFGRAVAEAIAVSHQLTGEK